MEKVNKIIRLLDNWGLIGLLVFAFTLAILLLNDYHGDSSIYIVYAKNLTEGYFLNFNQGEFSSGATSPLWAIINSLSFFIFDSVINLKLIALIFLLLSIYIYFNSINYILKDKFYSLVTSLAVLYFSLLPQIMGYETSLILIIISLLLRINFQIFTKQGHNLLYLWIVFMVFTFVRPDSLILIVLNIFFLVYNKKINLKEMLFLLSSLLFIFIYFIISQYITGTFSSSSYCRSFAQSETAPSVLGIKYSLYNIKLFLSFPIIISLVLIFLNSSKYKKLNRLALLFLFSYFFIFSFIKPIANDSDRYFIPVLAFFFPISFLVSVKKISITKTAKSIITVLYIVLIPILLLGVTLKNFNKYPKEKVFEKKLADFLNKNIESNAIILTYEVQIKYLLENNIEVLSLDGITDGKIAPFLNNSDIYSYLLVYKPDYIVLSNALNYRPYLKKSFLYDYYVSKQDSFDFKGISFKRVYENKNKEKAFNFTAWESLYKISYENK